MTDLCNIDGCQKAAYRKGLCDAHRIRLRRHGSPTGGRTGRGIPLSWIEQHKDYVGDGCLKWPFSGTPNGYGKVNIGGRESVASRVMCEAAHGAPPTAKHEACHTCDNGHLACMNPLHLYWGTRSQNILDRQRAKA